MFACEHAHLPTGLSPILRSQSLNASAIASCRLIPCFRAVMCMAKDISGLKLPDMAFLPLRLGETGLLFDPLPAPAPVQRAVGAVALPLRSPNSGAGAEIGRAHV